MNSEIEKMKRIGILWGFIMFLLVGSLTFFGLVYKKKMANYNGLENKYVNDTKEYLKSHPELLEDELKITKEELKNADYLKNLSDDENKCEGYVLIQKDEEIDYKAYIRCKWYTTEGYRVV